MGQLQEGIQWIHREMGDGGCRCNSFRLLIATVQTNALQDINGDFPQGQADAFSIWGKARGIVREQIIEKLSGLRDSAQDLLQAVVERTGDCERELQLGSISRAQGECHLRLVPRKELIYREGISCSRIRGAFLKVTGAGKELNAEGPASLQAALAQVLQYAGDSQSVLNQHVTPMGSNGASDRLLTILAGQQSCTHIHHLVQACQSSVLLIHSLFEGGHSAGIVKEQNIGMKIY